MKYINISLEEMLKTEVNGILTKYKDGALIIITEMVKVNFMKSQSWIY